MQTHEWEELLHEAPGGHLPGKKAVVEVIRLRKEIAAMRDRMWNTAKVFTHKDLGRCNPHADMAIDLTRILNGDNHE